MAFLGKNSGHAGYIKVTILWSLLARPSRNNSRMLETAKYCIVDRGNLAPTQIHCSNYSKYPNMVVSGSKIIAIIAMASGS